MSSLNCHLWQVPLPPSKVSGPNNDICMIDDICPFCISRSPSLVQESSKPHKASKVKQSQKDEAENQTPHFLDTMFDK